MRAEAVICGAGIAGVSAAYALAVERGFKEIVLVDQGAPLALTSDHSTECYRNWWPDPAMVALMNRSIDRLEMLARRSGNVFHLNRRGYLYCTADPIRAAELETSSRNISGFGAGELRLHNGAADAPLYKPHSAEGFEDAPVGADLILDRALLQRHFPYLSSDIIAALHVRRAGWFSAQQLGMYLLNEAKASGVKLFTGRVSGIKTTGGQVTSVYLENGAQIDTSVFIVAAGPHLSELGRMLGIELPVYNELHLKMAFSDTHAALSREAPLVVLSDPQQLDWKADEIDELAGDLETRYLLEELPSGLHTRPDGGPDSPIILVLWEYHNHRTEPVWPIPLDPMYPDVLLRGLPRLIPAMQSYITRAPRPRIDGGYYTRTASNRPLIGRLPVNGAYIIGALSGFGLMAACAAGELLAQHITGEVLPEWANSFELDQIRDAVSSDGQL